MGGFFGVISREDCTGDLFYGTDYHSHLGTMRGGLAVRDGSRIDRRIHDITNAQFRSKFDDDICRMKGDAGIGVISDFEDQPLIIGSHLGRYAIATVGVVTNLPALVDGVFRRRGGHFSEMCGGDVNPTEVVAMLINQEDSFAAGLLRAQEEIEGSCSILLLTAEGIYASRDRLGRTPVELGRKDGAMAVTFETSALPNLDFEHCRTLGPGEAVLLHRGGFESVLPPRDRLRICTFTSTDARMWWKPTSCSSANCQDRSYSPRGEDHEDHDAGAGTGLHGLRLRQKRLLPQV